MAPRGPLQGVPLLIGMAILACGVPAFAAVLPVTDCGDSNAPGQLRTLINAAQAGDTILVPGCTIVLTGPAGEDANASGDLDVAKNLTFQGLGQDATVIDGGGGDRVVHVLAGATVRIADLTLRNGSAAAADGGGLLNAGTLTLANVTVTRSTTASSGGGISNTGTLTAADMVISDNVASGNRGGGINNDDPATLDLVRGRVVGNRTVSFGGGIANIGGPATIADSLISGNSAGQNGGGINNFSQSSMTVTRSTISGNRSQVAGGGIRNTEMSTLALTNSTIAHNVADGGTGGGISLNTAGSTLTIVNSTVARNVDTSNSVGGAGGISKVSGTLLLSNSIVALNDAAPGTIQSDIDPADIDSGTGNLLGGEPGLGPLQDNGGPTPTMAPFPGSPAIDSGNNAAAAAAGLTTDQRGLPRVVDGDGSGVAAVDIGAVEVQPPAPARNFLAVLPTGTFASGDVFDLVLVLLAPGRTIVGAQATFDGVDVLGPLAACLVPSVLPTGEQTFTCPDIPAGVLGPGPHTLVVTIAFENGTSVTGAAILQLAP